MGVINFKYDVFNLKFDYKGQIYNGFAFKDRGPYGGCAKADMNTHKAGFITRAILYDIPRLKGVPYLEPGTPVYPEDLEAWEKKIGVKAGPGDAILHIGGCEIDRLPPRQRMPGPDS